MRFTRFIAAIAAVGCALAVAAQGIPKTTHWGKWGVDMKNTHKTANKAPAKVMLYNIFTVDNAGFPCGATDEAMYDSAVFGGFIAPRGPDTNIWGPGFASPLISSPPENAPTWGVYSVRFYMDDEGTADPTTKTNGRFVANRDTLGNWDVLGPVWCYAWVGEGVLYLYVVIPPGAIGLDKNGFNGVYPNGTFEPTVFFLQYTLSGWAWSGSGTYLPWRSSSPVFSAAKTIVDDPTVQLRGAQNIDALTSSDWIWDFTVPGDQWGGVERLYIVDTYSGTKNTASMKHVFSVRNPEGNMGGFGWFDTPTTTIPPALSTDYTMIFSGTHFGSIQGVNVGGGPGKSWFQTAMGSIDGPVVITKGNNLIWGTSVNSDTGRGGNAIQMIDQQGMTIVKSLTLDGAVVGGPAYDSTNNCCYVTVLADDPNTGRYYSELVKIAINEASNTPFTVSTMVKSVSGGGTVLGLFRTHPIIDGNGNVFIGTEDGWLYCFDPTLKVVSPYPLYVGGQVDAPVCIDDSGDIFVGTGNSVAIFGPAGPRPGKGSGLKQGSPKQR